MTQRHDILSLSLSFHRSNSPEVGSEMARYVKDGGKGKEREEKKKKDKERERQSRKEEEVKEMECVLSEELLPSE